MDMDLENYRWIMSTVPQVLGTITAIIFAGFFIWIEQLKIKVKKAETNFNGLVKENPDLLDQIIKHELFTGENSDCLYDKIDDFRESLLTLDDLFKVGSELDVYTFNLQMLRFSAEINKRRIEKAKKIKTPILYSGYTIIISLLFLILDELVMDMSFLRVPLYITSSIILLSTVFCMYLYFRWLLNMIFSASSDM